MVYLDGGGERNRPEPDLRSVLLPMAVLFAAGATNHDILELLICRNLNFLAEAFGGHVIIEIILLRHGNGIVSVACVGYFPRHD